MANTTSDCVLSALDVYERGTERRIGHLASLNPEAMTVVSRSEIRTGRVYSLRLAWNQRCGWTRTLQIEAEARWCRRDLGTEFHTIGFRFIQPNEALQQQIRTILEQILPQDAA